MDVRHWKKSLQEWEIDDSRRRYLHLQHFLFLWVQIKRLFIKNIKTTHIIKRFYVWQITLTWTNE